MRGGQLHCSGGAPIQGLLPPRGPGKPRRIIQLVISEAGTVLIMYAGPGCRGIGRDTSVRYWEQCTLFCYAARVA